MRIYKRQTDDGFVLHAGTGDARRSVVVTGGYVPSRGGPVYFVWGGPRPVAKFQGADAAATAEKAAREMLARPDPMAKLAEAAYHLACLYLRPEHAGRSWGEDGVAERAARAVMDAVRDYWGQD